ncbi:TetR/AcrR family transcriptional regulator [Actinocatenispora rupis]|uniref:TetR family transcriptional regulator n=1 Tax=Actinocatenispora rupis TaxID=519421 RepID=A0A8J3NC97_9ACTN|nr:TetR/AcrR family transcriptional regulator [Actinocatenispora rupis]GID13836.1 TetR family transcriptional regulator [Actinocatenispora rupis]
MVGAATVSGLRERKKQQTRDALIASAQRLFAAQGYEGTTTGQIAEAVDVSQRTLFRYFANKDEVALAPLDEAQDSFAAALRARPRRETPMTAMRAAMGSVFSGYADDESGPRRLRALGQTFDLIVRTPSLHATHLRRVADREAQIAAIVAEREGVDPVADPRPRLAAAVFDAALQVASTCQRNEPGELDPRALYAELERTLDALPGIFGHWRRTT